MAQFSIGQAAFSGYGLVARKPLSVVAWGIAYFVVVGLPAVAFFMLLGPAMIDAFKHMSATTPGARPDVASLMAMQGPLNLYRLVSIATGIVIRAILTAAVFRAILRPQQRGFFYLRLGADELWQGLLVICFFILDIVALIALGIVGAIVGGIFFAVGHAIGGVGGNLISFGGAGAVGIACLWVFIWLSLRFSMAAPMTFAEKQFRLFESWKFTKGQAGNLFWMALILFVVLFIICFVLYMITVLGVVGVIAASSHALDQGQLKSMFNKPPAELLKMFAPWAAVGLVVGSILTGAFHAIIFAPWATAYRQLSGVAGLAKETAETFS
jgi:hypothetical protein